MPSLDNTTLELIKIFFIMCAMHALCDYPLQGDFLSRGKNHTNPIPGVPWYQCLLAHSLIHGGAVLMITSRLDIALAEFVLHTIIDYSKCAGRFGFNTDQFLHILCKLIWLALLFR